LLINNQQMFKAALIYEALGLINCPETNRIDQM